MGLFNKTDEELKERDIQKKLNQLIDTIYESNLNEYERSKLVNYVNKIKKGGFNDFLNLDTFIYIILNSLDKEIYEELDIDMYLDSVISAYHEVVDKTSDDVERINEYFITNFIGKDGFIVKDIADSSMFAVFENKKDYFEIMQIIKNSNELCNNIDYIIDYINSVCKYCLNQDILKRDIISYLDGFYTATDYDEYNKYQLEEAKKRIGIYNLSSKELASVNSSLGKVEGYLEQFQIYIDLLKEEKESLNSLVESSKKDIKDETKRSVDYLKNMVEKHKQVLIKKLDAYLLDLENILKDKSDETFKQIVETYKNQVEEFRNMFKGYSAATTKDFLAIQKESEESIKRLKDYVTNNPELLDVLEKAQKQEVVKTKLVELMSKEKELEEKAIDKELIEVPGYNRLMVPYKHLVLPPNIPKLTIRAFDDSIPFDKRMKEIEIAMKAKEMNGAIFHKKVKEIIIDIMEGDWPYLWGPSGTGKSYMIKQVASILGLNYRKAGKITEPYSILGYNDPQGIYQITPSFIAALYGELLFLDELDNGNPDTQVVLNDLYSELLNKLENKNEPCEVTFGTDVLVDIHPNFRMISAGNTSGEGENPAFSSRGKFDESVMERMSPIYIDYDNSVEERILKEYPVWYKFFIDFREACIDYSIETSNGKNSAQGITTTRDAAAIKKYIDHNSKSVDQVLDEKFIQIKDSEYRRALAKRIAEIYNIDYGTCTNASYNGSLKKVDNKTLAKKFISKCKEDR